MKAKTYLLTASLSLLLPLVSNAAPEGKSFERYIVNESLIPWTVSNTALHGNLHFDASPKRGPAVCKESPVQPNGPCTIAKSNTSFVKFTSTHGKCDGVIMFTAPLKKTVNVSYSCSRRGISMSSNHPDMVNDDHGDLHIKG